MASEKRFFAPIDFKTRFPALDGIRALAILGVFADHYGGGSHGGAILVLLNTIRERGWVGVDLFFVLSGFLITGILYDTHSDSHFFKRFFARRSVRIFPVYYLSIAVLLLLTPSSGWSGIGFNSPSSSTSAISSATTTSPYTKSSVPTPSSTPSRSAISGRSVSRSSSTFSGPSQSGSFAIGYASSGPPPASP